MAKITKTAAELRDQIAASTASARNFLRSLFDEGTFLEFGTYVKNGENGSFEGVITGCGAVDGRPVYAFVQDKENEKAAFTAAHGKKIVALPCSSHYTTQVLARMGFFWNASNERYVNDFINVLRGFLFFRRENLKR